jgi:plasmid stability protein
MNTRLFQAKIRSLRAAARAVLEHVRRMWHSLRMPKMIQVRNVPERLHRELQRRARTRGMTLTDYIQEVLERHTARPPAEEVIERIRGRSSVQIGRSAASLIREERALRGDG